jgi:hypothetical protein
VREAEREAQLTHLRAENKPAQTGDFAMYIPRAPSAFPLSLRLQAAFARLPHAMKFVGTVSDAAQPDASKSGLEAHLQYDIGEIDYDPHRTRSFDNLPSYETRLWLQYYPR